MQLLRIPRSGSVDGVQSGVFRGIELISHRWGGGGTEGRGACSGLRADPAEMRIWRRQLYPLSLVIPPGFCLAFPALSIQAPWARCSDAAALPFFPGHGWAQRVSRRLIPADSGAIIVETLLLNGSSHRQETGILFLTLVA